MFADTVAGELIPIFGIFMIIAVVVGPIWIRSHYAARDRAQMHETMRVAYEKGQPVPPELIEKLTESVTRQQTSVGATADADLRRAVVLIAVGLGLAGLGAGLYYGISFGSEEGGAITGGIVAGAGAIPGFIGLAYLVLYLTRRSAPHV
ncbi:MAG TPA: DUF6249 domain-containing protein [Caulobacteraceae bacterium]|nr:DUF6249 domain-containing protein [Caulobacteraceae bacterium]